jgi:ATP-dependent DNA helicase RecQ
VTGGAGVTGTPYRRAPAAQPARSEPRMPTTTTAAEAQSLLERLAGPDARLRDDQATAIATLVDERRRALLVQRTGWGKSAVYWIATALNRARGHGPTLVVSPLLALMRDQVDAARRMGLDAERIDSTNPDAWQAITDRLAADDVDVLLISPERLNSHAFRPHLAELAPRLGMLVVDEAHAISDWAHDFRPDYGRIVHLLDDLDDDVPVLACTATANGRVVADVEGQIGDDTVTLRGPLGRASLHLSVVHLPSTPERLAWLAGFVRAHRPVHGHAGIVYTLTVDDAERTAEFLTGRGLDVEAYTSRLSPEERQATEDALKQDRLDAVVATSALGMGYDKPDLAFVAHLGAPSSPISYYQQVGRAGRAIDRAEVVLLPTRKDERIWRHFDLDGIPTEDETRRVVEALREEPLSIPRLERAVDVRRTRLDLLLKVLDVAGSVAKTRDGWSFTGEEYVHDDARYRRLRQARMAEHDAMRAYIDPAFDGCLMRHLTSQLDDDRADPCGRCAACTGATPEVTIDPEDVEAARTFVRKRDVVLFPRRRWPTGLEVRGNIAPERRPEEGRALTGDDDAWGDQVDRLLNGDDGPIDQVVAGLVDVLARWRWPARPTQIVPVPSPRHGALNAEVARRLGDLGRLPVVPALVGDPEAAPQQTTANSAHRARNALATYRRADAPPEPGPVLLLDAAADSGWTLAVTSWLLTEDEPRVVLPLVLSTRLPD